MNALDLRAIPRRLWPQGAAAPATTLTIAPFLALARELSALLTPVEPRQTFRDELYHSLLIAARQHQAQTALDIVPPAAGWAESSSADPLASLRGLMPEGVDRRWTMGAAAVGGAISLGILAYFLRHRDRPRAAA
jgi:hypothetical protein